MADKQIKDFANTPLADTDSLVKQSISGLTSKTTYGEIKADLDGRYLQYGTVIWEDDDGAKSIPITLPNNRIYEFWIKPIDISTPPTGFLIVTVCKKTDNASLAYFLTNYQGAISDGAIYTADTAPMPNIVITKGYCYKIIDLGEPI